MAAGINDNHDNHVTHNLASGMLAPSGIYVVTHRDTAHEGAHEVRIAAPILLPECNTCRRVRFSRKCDITPPIEEYKFFLAGPAVNH
jgi:hypothetical protein